MCSFNLVVCTAANVFACNVWRVALVFRWDNRRATEFLRVMCLELRSFLGGTTVVLPHFARSLISSCCVRSGCFSVVSVGKKHELGVCILSPVSWYLCGYIDTAAPGSSTAAEETF